MRIDQIDLVAVGPLRDTRLNLAAPATGFTLVVGPNEAGKSTALAAVGFALFGLPSGQKDIAGTPREQLHVIVRGRGADGRAVEIDRDGRGSPRVVTADNGHSPADLDALLGGIGRETFDAMFRIDHTELVRGSADLLAADGALGTLLFGATLGATSLVPIRRAFEARLDDLLGTGRRNSRVRVALRDRRAALTQSSALRTDSRTWQSLDDTFQGVSQEAEALAAELRARRAERDALARVERTRSGVQGLRALVDRAATIRASGAVRDFAWRAEAREALETLEVALDDDAQHAQVIDAAGTALADLEVSEAVLLHGEAIEDLARNLARWTSESATLAGLRVQQAQAVDDLSELAVRLGTADGPDDRARRLADAPDALLADVDRLVAARSEVEAALEQATIERDRADARHTACAERCTTLGAPTGDTAMLRHARDAGAQALPAVGTRSELRTRVEELEAEAAALGQRLGLGERDPAAIESLPVPSRARIDRMRDVETRITQHLAELDRRLAELTEPAAPPPVPSDADLAAARAHRDAGWALLEEMFLTRSFDRARLAAWTRGSDYPSAFRAAMTAADAVADARFTGAAELQRVHEHEQQRVTLEDQRVAARRERLAHDAAWTDLWRPVGVDVGTPAEMGEWRDEYERLLARLENARELRPELAALSERVDAAVADLRGALTALDEMPPGVETAGLATLLEAADAVLARRDGDADLRRRAIEERDRAQEDLAGRSAELRRLQKDLEEVLPAWGAMEAALGFTEPQSVVAVAGTRNLVGEVRIAQRTLHHLDGQIRELVQSTVRFEQQTREVAARVDPTSVDSPPGHIVPEMARRLAQDREAAARRDELHNRMQLATDARLDAQARANGALDRLRQTAHESGLAPDAAPEVVVAHVRAVVEGSEELDGILHEIGRAELHLVEIGDGRSVDELVEEAAAHPDPDAVTAARARLDDEIAAMEARREDVHQRLGRARRELEAVDGSDAAAAAEVTAEEAFARAAAAAEEWVRTRLAAAVLDRAIDDFGGDDRHPVLDRAAAHFRRMTDDAFVDLVVDRYSEPPRVLAARRNGEAPLAVDQLSDGTRDQLYLALRLAGVEHLVASLSEPVPLVLDDLLVNFDDRRAEAALQVLAEVGTCTQVLLFTHHEHLVDLARSVLDDDRCAVVRLPARDHDAVAPSAGSRGATAVAVADQLVECLAAAEAPLTRREVLERAGIHRDEWSTAIAELLASGRVVKEGETKGTRYRLPW